MSQPESSSYVFEMPDQHEYEGIVYCSAFQRQSLDKIKTMDFHSDDIILSNYPKSGTLWAGEIIWLIMNDVDIETAQKVQNRQRVVVLESSRPGQQPNVDKLMDMKPGTRIMSTHLMPSFFKCLREKTNLPKFIYLTRNPKDSLVSYYHFYRANAVLGSFSGSFHDFFKVFEAKQLNHGDYFDHMIAWSQHEMKDHFLFVTYEDMKKDLAREVKRICAFLNKTITDEQMKKIIDYSSIEKMKKNPMAQMYDNPMMNSNISPYVRKGQVGGWKTEMSVAESEFIDELCREKLQPLGIDMQFTS